MKGAQGLVVAAILGLLGVVLNWLYLDSKTSGVANVSFLGIKQDAQIKTGDLFKEDHFVAVNIPERNAGNLKNFVYLYQDRKTVTGIRATRPYRGDELVFRRDYRTPPTELTLEKNERLIWIPVDSRSFVPSLLDPGDEIDFIFPARKATDSKSPIPLSSGPEMIGPFRIGSLGNRLGSQQVMRASRTPQLQERQIGIIAEVEGNKFVARVMTLLDRLQKSNNRNVGVALHPKKKAE